MNLLYLMYLLWLILWFIIFWLHGWVKCIVCKKSTVQILQWSLEFVTSSMTPSKFRSEFSLKMKYLNYASTILLMIISKILLACGCLFISFHRKDFSWLNKTINVTPEFRSVMVCCGNISVSSTICPHVIDDHSRNLPAVRESVN